MSKQILIYTDGACRGNPGPGGWGAVLQFADKEKRLYGGERETTNNRMELTAVIRALECLKDNQWPVRVVTDSKYVLQGITEWIKGWKKKGWRTASKKPVMNAELWQELDALVERFDIQWEWVKGHSGHRGNELADELANRGIDEL